MTDAVAYTTSNGLAVLTVQNSPVNALSQAVRRGLVDQIARATADAQVRLVVIAGKGGTFPAGADIREFGSAAAGALPNLVDVCAAIEACPNFRISFMCIVFPIGTRVIGGRPTDSCA